MVVSTEVVILAKFLEFLKILMNMCLLSTMEKCFSDTLAKKEELLWQVLWQLPLSLHDGVFFTEDVTQ